MKGSLNVLKLFSPRLTQQIGPGRHLAAFFTPQEPEGDEGGVDDDGEGDVDLQHVEPNLPSEAELEEDHGGVSDGRHRHLLSS